MDKTISTSELAQHLANPTFVVIDVRPMAAYNGWRLRGEARGGHIPGSVPFPLSWAVDTGAADLTTLLQSKGISQDNTVVVYGYTRSDSTTMVNRLEDLGYGNVLVYEAGLAEWAADDTLPMAHLVNYDKLVHPEWVHRLIHEQHAETYAGQGFAIFHVNAGVFEEYEQGHIPGAMPLDTNALEAAPLWNRLPAKELAAALLTHGITHDQTIVLYGRHTDPDPNESQPGLWAGHIAAARAAAILMYAGVEDVRLLDGGFEAWLSAGYEIEREGDRPTPGEAFGTQIPARPAYIIDLEEVKALLADPDGVLVSVRSWPEHVGETSGYSEIEARGRIAGAVWGQGGSDPYHMQHYRNIDHTMRNYHDIEANWRDAGITPDKRIAFYCGTGWRASETFFYAYLLGWPNIAVYDGGWLEWSQDASNPTERGEP